MIIGYGTGRCGTKSLVRFLSQYYTISQEGMAVNWYPVFSDPFVRVKNDVGYYWIHYLHLVDAKFINIVRDDEAVIESFWKSTPDYKVFGENEWFGYPYDSDKPTKDAIAQTVKRYRFLEKEAQRRFKVFTMKTDDLNHPLDDLLTWLKE